MLNVFKPILDLLRSEKERVLIGVDSEDLNGQQCLSRIAFKQQTLTNSGVKGGDKILIFTGRGVEFWLDVLAVWGINGVAIPVDAQTNQSTLDYIIAKAEPKFSIGCSELLSIGQVCSVFYPKLQENGATPIAKEILVSDIASILFTSGTTGEPKGVVLSHKAISGNATATVKSFEMNNIDRLFVPIPFRFVSALSHFVATLYNGVSYKGSERKYLKTELLEELASNDCDAFGGSPLQLRWISELADKYPLKLKWLMSSGDNLPSQVIETLHSVLPDVKVVTAYGLTELAGRFCILPPSKTKQKIGSVGKPIDGLKYVILNENHVPISTGETGEIYVCGEFLFNGYLNDPDKTDDSMSRNGFATGDIGSIDEQGYLYLSGRSDDIFKSAGLKVSTLPIAALLMSSGQFEDLTVTSKIDELLGRVPVVYYVLKSGGKLDKGPLMKSIRSKLPPGHLPREFHPVNKIPRTGSGKVQRKLLIDLVEA